jgi:hypothetical protein
MATQLLLSSKLELQSVLGTPKTITAITKVSEAVITGTHDFAIGDLIVIGGVVGMTEINNRVVRVKSVSTTVSFVAEGLDTSGSDFTTYVSGGTATKVTTLLNFSDLASGFNYPEPSPNPIDVTPISAKSKVEVFGLDDAPTLTIPMFADPTNSSVVEMRKASLAKTARVLRFTAQNGNVMICNAYLTGGRGFDGSVGAVATAQLNAKLLAPEQWFAS